MNSHCHTLLMKKGTHTHTNYRPPRNRMNAQYNAHLEEKVIHHSFTSPQFHWFIDTSPCYILWRGTQLEPWTRTTVLYCTTHYTYLLGNASPPRHRHCTLTHTPHYTLIPDPFLPRPTSKPTPHTPITNRNTNTTLQPTTRIHSTNYTILPTHAMSTHSHTQNRTRMREETILWRVLRSRKWISRTWRGGKANRRRYGNEGCFRWGGGIGRTSDDGCVESQCGTGQGTLIISMGMEQLVKEVWNDRSSNHSFIHSIIVYYYARDLRLRLRV